MSGQMRGLGSRHGPRQKEPLHSMTAAERADLERVARMASQRADRVTLPERS